MNSPGEADNSAGYHRKDGSPSGKALMPVREETSGAFAVVTVRPVQPSVMSWRISVLCKERWSGYRVLDLTSTKSTFAHEPPVQLDRQQPGCYPR
jgi:hypothetical protein